MPVEYTEITLFDYLIQEPMGLLTDWLITAFSLYWGLKLLTLQDNSKYFAYFFILLGLSTFFGGAAHGFFYKFGINMHRMAWITSALALFILQMAVLRLFNDFFQKVMVAFSVFQLIFFGILFTLSAKFMYTGINLAVGLLFVVLLFAWRKNERFDLRVLRRNFSIGIGILLLPGILVALRFNPHKWFNSNDLSHLIIILALYFLFRGARLIPAKA
jgi:hypothetical protein